MACPCPCGSEAVQVGGDVIYPHRPDLAALRFWRCPDCGRYVGAHKNGGGPLGVPADSATRRARRHAHELFDPIWRQARNPKKARGTAYRWLATALGRAGEEIHIGAMDEDEANRVQEICRRHRFR